MKLTNARPGDDLERRDERGYVIVVQVANVFTTTLPDSGANVRCADYRANGDGEVYRMRVDQDPDVWTLVDACTACGRRRRRCAESEWCEGCCRRSASWMVRSAGKHGTGSRSRRRAEPGCTAV